MEHKAYGRPLMVTLENEHPSGLVVCRPIAHGVALGWYITPF